MVVLLTTLAVVLGFVATLWAYFISRFGPVQKGVIAFFHPFADDGGGGERVLWCAIQALQSEYPNYEIAIYVQSGVSADQLVKDSSTRFNVTIDRPIRVVILSDAHRLLPSRFRRFTLLRQAIASVCVAAQGLQQLVPEVFVDTTGWAFPYPLAVALGSRVACYVHYPTVSADMLEDVRRGRSAVNNAQDIARSRLKTLVKVLYYRIFAKVYGFCGRRAAVAMANSSWTLGHVRQIWGGQNRTLLVFPPVDTSTLTQLPVPGRPRVPVSLVSVNQFRPEKNHRLQIESFALARRKAADNPVVQSAVLRLVGGSRHRDDAARIEDLRRLAVDFGIDDHVQWYVNAPYGELRRLLGEATAGLHSMCNEHFGIGIVEYMAGGAVAIAHNSGGPRSDIITPAGVGRIGFLATSSDEYADSIIKVLSMDEEEWSRVSSAGQEASKRFSTENFQEAFVKAMSTLLTHP